ncbi:MAG: glycosyltransferase family A protein [Candidatus Binatia bacterium]
MIVVDDGSTDASPAVLAGLHDPRLDGALAQANRGAHAALNTGIEHAAAPVIAVLNSDDAYHPERLALACRRATAAVSVVGSWIEIVDADDAALGSPAAAASRAQLPRRRRPARRAAHREPPGDDVELRLPPGRLGGGRRLPAATLHARPGLRLAPVGAGAAPSGRAAAAALSGARAQYDSRDRAAMVFEICWCLAVHLPRHVTAPWSGGASGARLEQLLASLYTFGCETVLATLLAFDLAHDEPLALALLDPGDGRRQVLLDAVRERLAAAPAAAPAPAPWAWRPALRRWLRAWSRP